MLSQSKYEGWPLRHTLRQAQHESALDYALYYAYGKSKIILIIYLLINRKLVTGF